MQIDANHAHLDDEQRRAAVGAHLHRFWTEDMLERLRRHVASSPEAVSDVVRRSLLPVAPLA